MDNAARKKRTEDVGAIFGDAAAAGNGISSGLNSKRTKMTTNSNILTILDETALLQVLLRTRCEDHNALRQTCRRFQGIIDSDLFRQERAQQEWAQVEVQVLTVEENFQKASAENHHLPSFFRNNCNDLGRKLFRGAAIQNEFRVMVDGKVGGSGNYTLIERNDWGQSSNNSFHLTCDVVSQEVYDTGSLFFDKQGRPRMPSLKEAMMSTMTRNSTSTRSAATGHPKKKEYFLYLDRFLLNAEHRQNNATWVGAKAVRSLLLDSPLQDQWSVVIYIADVTAHQTKQDESRAWRQEMYERKHLYPSRSSAKGEEERKTEEEKKKKDWQESIDWMERERSLKKMDLYQFVRSGFQQTTDSLQKSSCLYVMAVSSFLSRPMLSHKEALSVKIVDKKDLSAASGSEMSAALFDDKLSRYMAHSCAIRQELFETMLRKQSTPLTGREAAATSFDSQPAGLRRNIVEAGQIALTEARADLAKHDRTVKAEVAKLVGEKSNNSIINAAAACASVKNSSALHACARHMIPEYIELLLEFTHSPAERRCALNKFDDEEGLTPLMIVAISPNISSNFELRVQMANKLIALGADKNVADVFGETALGKFRAATRLSSRDNVAALFGWAQPPTPADLDRERRRMEQLLRPVGGPTAADNSYV
jgi:hypothetical protein